MSQLNIWILKNEGIKIIIVHVEEKKMVIFCASWYFQLLSSSFIILLRTSLLFSTIHLASRVSTVLLWVKQSFLQNCDFRQAIKSVVSVKSHTFADQKLYSYGKYRLPRLSCLQISKSMQTVFESELPLGSSYNFEAILN